MRLALPGSVALHVCFLVLVIVFVGRPNVISPPSGLAPITVHLVKITPVPKLPITPTKIAMRKSYRNIAVPRYSVAASNPVPQPNLQEARTSDSGVRILEQPMPQIPDNLRAEAFSTSAMARFHVKSDGSAEVELLTPSQNPRLNHLLLQALKNWKFAPATHKGAAVDADFDIRVHFAVQ